MRGVLAKLFGLAALSLVAACQNVPVADLPVSSITPAVLTSADATPQHISASIAMPQGNAGRYAEPAAYVAFCARDPDQCKIPANQPDTIVADDATWALLIRTNAQLNRDIKPLSDADHYGVAEYWTISTDGYGDCEDIALAKRQALAAAGLPIRALRIATVVSRHDDRHAVLTVATDRGDYVLDNLTPAILPWTETGFIWLTRQDPTRGWVTINAMPEMDTASTGTADIR